MAPPNSSRAASQSSLLESPKTTIEEIKESIKNCQGFIQKNKNENLVSFWDDSFPDSVPFSDLSADALKSGNELLIALFKSAVQSAKSVNDTQIVTGGTKEDLIREFSEILRELKADPQKEITSKDRRKLTDYYEKDIRNKLSNRSKQKSTKDSEANLYRAIPHIGSLLRFFAIKEIVEGSLLWECLRKEALIRVQKQVQGSLNDVQKKWKPILKKESQNNNKKLENLKPTLIN